MQLSGIPFMRFREITAPLACNNAFSRRMYVIAASINLCLVAELLFLSERDPSQKRSNTFLGTSRLLKTTQLKFNFAIHKPSIVKKIFLVWSPLKVH